MQPITRSVARSRQSYPLNSHVQTARVLSSFAPSCFALYSLFSKHTLTPRFLLLFPICPLARLYYTPTPYKIISCPSRDFIALKHRPARARHRTPTSTKPTRAARCVEFPSRRRARAAAPLTFVRAAGTSRGGRRQQARRTPSRCRECRRFRHRDHDARFCCERAFADTLENCAAITAFAGPENADAQPRHYDPCIRSMMPVVE
jgi:hypothetical protein